MILRSIVVCCGYTGVPKHLPVLLGRVVGKKCLAKTANFAIQQRLHTTRRVQNELTTFKFGKLPISQYSAGPPSSAMKGDHNKTQNGQEQHNKQQGKENDNQEERKDSRNEGAAAGAKREHAEVDAEKKGTAAGGVSADPLQQKSPPPTTLEQGRIYFFFRPKVGVGDEPKSQSDAQRFYFIMKPAEGKARMAILGKKKFPEIKYKERFYGFIDVVGDSVSELVGENLESLEYSTATRGERKVEPARALGEGVYSIVKHGNRHTHLVYSVEVPLTVGEAQKEFGIQQEASYVLVIKNPYRSSQRNIGIDRKAEYSEELKQLFKSYAWIAVEDTRLLDYEHCEFLLVGAADDIQDELGEDGEHLNTLKDEDVKEKTEGVEDEQEATEKLVKKAKAEIQGGGGDSSGAAIKTAPLESGTIE